MSLFSAVVRTVVNVATLPVAVVKDVATMGGVVTRQNPMGHASQTYTAEKLQQIKDEAEP